MMRVTGGGVGELRKQWCPQRLGGLGMPQNTVAEGLAFANEKEAEVCGSRKPEDTADTNTHSMGVAHVTSRSHSTWTPIFI